MDWREKVNRLRFAGWNLKIIGHVAGADRTALGDLSCGRVARPRYELGSVIVQWNELAERSGLLRPYPEERVHVSRADERVATVDLEELARLRLMNQAIARRIGAWDGAVTSWRNYSQSIPKVFADAITRMLLDCRNAGLFDFLCQRRYPE